MKFVLFCIWLILALFALDISLAMVSAANTVENIMGLILIALFAVGSVYTKCFTITTRLWQRK